MKKGLIGFLVGLFVIAVVFISTVSIMSSVNKRTFTEEINSWFDTEKTETLPDEELPEDTEGEEDNTEGEVNTEATALITYSDGNINLKVA